MYGTGVYGVEVYGEGRGHPYAGVAGRLMWLVQVDWDRDGVFGSLVEPQSIRALELVRGRSRRVRADGRGLETPGSERFRVVIQDPAGRYDGFNQAGPLYAHLGGVGQAVRVLLVSSTSREAAGPVFVGTLQQVEYRAQDGLAVLSGEGLSAWLQTGQAGSLWTPAQPVWPGEAWDEYFIADGSTPAPVNYWKGRPGGLGLRACAALTLERAGWPFEAFYGQGELGLVSDQPDYFYFDGSSAWDVLQELGDGFAARLLFLRDGRLYVMDRSDLSGLEAGLSAPARAQQAAGLVRVSAVDSLRNTLRVNVRPHSVVPFRVPYPPQAFVEAWSNSGPLALGPGETLEIDVHYAGSKPLQGSFLSVNNGGFPVNFEAWSAADRTGTLMSSDGTGEAEFTLLWEQVNGATVPYGNNQSWTRVRFKNWSATRTAYYFDMKVMLIGIIESGQPVVQQVTDEASAALNGARVLTINSRWVQTAQMGANIAQAYAQMLASREQASPATVTYQWSGEALYQNLMRYDLGTHVNFGTQGGSAAQANFGIWGRWLVVGQSLRWLSADGQDGLVSLTFEKAADSAEV